MMVTFTPVRVALHQDWVAALVGFLLLFSSPLFLSTESPVYLVVAEDPYLLYSLLLSQPDNSFKISQMSWVKNYYMLQVPQVPNSVTIVLATVSQQSLPPNVAQSLRLEARIEPQGQLTAPPKVSSQDTLFPALTTIGLCFLKTLRLQKSYCFSEVLAQLFHLPCKIHLTSSEESQNVLKTLEDSHCMTV